MIASTAALRVTLSLLLLIGAALRCTALYSTLDGAQDGTALHGMAAAEQYHGCATAEAVRRQLCDGCATAVAVR